MTLSPAAHNDPTYRRGFMFILSSPSGAGKTTLSRLLLEREKGLTMSVSTTTRPMRPGEVEGQDYFFVDQPRFDTMAAQDELLEYATVFDRSYGTPRSFVMEALEQGTDVLFDIDWQGTQQLAASCREDMASIFILPPSVAELEARLRKRGQDSEETVTYRMERAASEMSHWDEYDYVVINHHVEDCLQQITHILHAERCKRTRQTNLAQFIQSM